MKPNQTEIHRIALELAKQEVMSFRFEARTRAEEFCVGKLINVTLITEASVNGLQAERIIRRRRQVLKKQLRTIIQENAEKLVKKRIVELAREFEQQMESELGEFESRLHSYEPREKLVTVRNVVLVHRVVDGEPVGDYQRQVTLPVKEFNHMVQSGKLAGYKSNGVVYGLLESEDYTAEDFATEGKVEVDAGNGITAVLYFDQWVDQMTRFKGNEERTVFLNNTEIIYGRAQEGFGAEREREAEQSDDTNQPVDYARRTKQEQHYWVDYYQDSLNQCKSHQELYRAVSGVLFPNREGKWLRPVDCMGAIDRRKLLGKYHSMVEQVKADREELLQRVLEWRKNKKLSFTTMINSLSKKDAQGVLIEAANRRKKTGETPLDLNAWKLLNTISKRAA